MARRLTFGHTIGAVNAGRDGKTDTYPPQSGADRDDPGDSDETETDLSPRVWVRRLSAWRKSIRRRPRAHRIYKIVVGLVGLAIVAGGIALVPLPGPGWVIVFLGLHVLATEYSWAAAVEDFAKRQVKTWTRWLGQQHLAVRILFGILTAAFVACALWALFAISGVPDWVPDRLVPGLPGLG
jgi:uncharacterized protein (TIGR02611 family)